MEARATGFRGRGCLDNGTPLWVIRDGATEIAIISVTLVLTGNEWKLAAYPTF